jgi:hypothetical protein
MIRNPVKGVSLCLSRYDAVIAVRQLAYAAACLHSSKVEKAGHRLHESDHAVASGWENCFRGSVELLIDWRLFSVVTATVTPCLREVHIGIILYTSGPKKGESGFPVIYTAHPLTGRIATRSPNTALQLFPWRCDKDRIT